MYKIPSERERERDAMKIRTQRTSAYVTRGSPRKLQFSKLTPKKFVESAHTKPRRSMIAIRFGIHLSFTMSSMLCVHGLRVLHSNIRPILFEFCDPQCVHSIQYGTTLHFNTGKNQKDNASVVGHARLFCITRELRTQISLNSGLDWTRIWTGLDWTGLDWTVFQIISIFFGVR